LEEGSYGLFEDSLQVAPGENYEQDEMPLIIFGDECKL
jgi:hypothetical protein